MSGIRTLGPVQLVTASDMSVNIVSPAVDMLSLTFGTIEARWVGTPTGTFSVDGSLDGTNWYQTLTDVNNPAGSSASTAINISNLAFRYLRLSYTAGGGVGALDVVFFGKAGGG